MDKKKNKIFHEEYDNGMNMHCHRYNYDHVQKLVLENDIIEYDTLEIESDNYSCLFGFSFTYYFYYLNGNLVKTQIG